MPADTNSRVACLTDFFEQVLTERMADLPIVNPELRVEAIGFRFAAPRAADCADSGQVGSGPLVGYQGSVGEGVLITPWFMSLVRLPAARIEVRQSTGVKRVRQFGTERFEFIGNHDAQPGYFETCALFSPMSGFADQAIARDTGLQVLSLLRPVQRQPDKTASRRRFLTGRPSAVQAH